MLAKTLQFLNQRFLGMLQLLSKFAAILGKLLDWAPYQLAQRFRSHCSLNHMTAANSIYIKAPCGGDREFVQKEDIRIPWNMYILQNSTANRTYGIALNLCIRAQLQKLAIRQGCYRVAKGSITFCMLVVKHQKNEIVKFFRHCHFFWSWPFFCAHLRLPNFGPTSGSTGTV
jgi:hypothetical protein